MACGTAAQKGQKRDKKVNKMYKREGDQKYRQGVWDPPHQAWTVHCASAPAGKFLQGRASVISVF